MAKFVDLKSNRDLINSNFDHYQLSLDKIPKNEINIDNVDVAKTPELGFSSHHAKLYSIHNNIFSDPWDPLSVYFCDREWNIGQVAVNSASGALGEMQLSKPELRDSVFQVPDATNLRLTPVRFSVSLGFPSQSLAVIVNGVDSLYLLKTHERKSQNKWKLLFSASLSAMGSAHQLIDCSHWLDGEAGRLEVLLAQVEELEGESKEKHGSPFITVLTWLTLLSVDGETWEIERTRRLESSRPFDYACLEPKGAGIQVVSQQMYKMTEDSLKPVEEEQQCDTVGDDSLPLYTWSQTASDLTVHLTIPDGITKSNLNITMSATRLEVSVKNDIDMLKGDLFARIQVDSSTWTLEGRRLELSLQKVDEEMWSNVVVGDSRGELVLTSEQVEAIHERLAHLTSEHWNANPDILTNKPYNSQMLEECDAVDDDGVILSRIDGESHKTTHKAVSGEQFLFKTRIKPDGPMAFCLRNDVDGFIWQTTSDTSNESNIWQHVGVLNAFGYVMASKMQRRFCSCSEDMSMGVIADAQRHVYIYRQKVNVLSPVRNRKTGVQISSVAKQQVISLDCTPNYIVGLHITNTKLFLLTEKRLFVYSLTDEE